MSSLRDEKKPLLNATLRWFLLAMLLANISSAMVRPSFGSFIAEQSPEETRGRVYGISMGLFLVVDVIGPLIGGFLADRYGFTWHQCGDCVAAGAVDRRPTMGARQPRFPVYAHGPRVAGVGCAGMDEARLACQTG